MFRAQQPPFLTVLAFTVVAFVAMAFAVNPVYQNPGSRPTSKEDGEWNKGLRLAADQLIASKKFRGRHRDLEWVRYTGGTRLRHPLLEKYLPDRRFYLVELRIQCDNQPPRNLLHQYCLTILRTKDKKGTTYNRGELKALEYLKASNVRARTATQAGEVHELEQVLDSIGGGDSQAGTPLSKQKLYKRHALGFPKPEKPLTKRLVPRVVEAGSKRYAVTCYARCDDWNMPVMLSYRLLTFDRRTGKLLGVTARRGKTFPNKEFSKEAQDREYTAFLQQLARESH